MAELKAGTWPLSEIDPKIIDPDGLYLPRDPREVSEEQEARTRGTKDMYQAPFRPPFSAVDNSDQENINPRDMDDKKASKHAAAHRDHSKDGERDYKYITDEYMNKKSSTDMLESSPRRKLSEMSSESIFELEDTIADMYSVGESLPNIYKSIRRNYGLRSREAIDAIERVLGDALEDDVDSRYELEALEVVEKLTNPLNKPLDSFKESSEEDKDIPKIRSSEIHPDSRTSELIEDAIESYESEYDGVSTFEDLMKDEPDFEGGSDSIPPEIVEESKIWRSRSLKEARGDLDVFFRENPAVLKKDMKAAYLDHKNWATKKGIEPAWPETFKRALFRAQQEKPSVSKAEEPPKPLSKIAQVISSDVEATKATHVEDTFKNLVDVAAKIASRETMAPHHAFIYGTGGVGKSYTIVKTVEDVCATDPELEKWKILKGSTTAAGLYQLLYSYRDGWVLIFDDNDGVLGDVNALNYLKAAMDPDQPRFVSKSSMRTLENVDTTGVSKFLREDLILREKYDDEDIDDSDLDDEEENVSDDSSEEFVDTSADENVDKELLRRKNIRTMRNEKSVYWIDHIDPSIDPASIEEDEDEGTAVAKGKIPSEFQFASRIIFISNKPDLPQPLQDRTESAEVKLSKKEILDRIEGILDYLLDKEPKLIEMKDHGRGLKMEVLKYLRACVAAEEEGISDEEGTSFIINAPLTFRFYSRCVAYRVMYPGEWRKKVIKALREKSAGKIK